MLLLRTRVDLEAMVRRGTLHSPKFQYYRNLTIRLLSVISGHSLGESYPSAEKESVYSTAPADTAKEVIIFTSLFLHLLAYPYLPNPSTQAGYDTRCPWCSRYLRRKWTRRHDFKSWTRLIAFHIALILLGKV